MSRDLVTRRTSLIVALVGVCVILAAAGLYGSLAERRAAALRAQADTLECEHFAQAIRHLREQPNTARVQAFHRQELTQRIEDAARDAGMTAASLQSIVPDPGKRVGEAPYVRQSTRLSFQGISVAHLAAFAQQLSAEAAELRATRIDLKEPPGSSVGDVWAADVTLTYLVFAPQEVSRQGSGRSTHTDSGD